MKLNNGFYLFTSHLTGNEKYQCVKEFFEITNENNIIVYNFNKSFLPPILDISLKPIKKGKLDSTDESSIYTFFQSNKLMPFYIKRKLIQMRLNPGEKYFNIYRPLLTQKVIKSQYQLLPCISDYIDSSPITNQEYNNLLCQLEIVLNDLTNLFKTVALHRSNLMCFGHNIRNIIILACTEIDSMMKNILQRNQIQPINNYYKTNDYYVLADILKLKNYAIRFHRHHDFGTLTPFKDWSKDNPTKSLVWYDSYNKIKHDRENNFELANMKNAIDSVAAFAITLIAQFGYRNILWNDKINKVIEVIEEPSWNIEDFYIPRRDSDVISDLYEDAKPYPKIESDI